MGGGRSAAAILASLLVLTPALGSAEQLEPYVVCAHVPITGAAPIPHHPDRFGQFYFDAVNAEQGGIDGHPVQFYAYNDNYSPAGARDAAEQCRRLDLDLLVGLVGQDQIVSVARWAELNQIPYLHGHIAGANLDEEGSWSASLGPDDEHMMQGLASTLMTAPAPRIATVYVDSPSYEPGRIAFSEAIDALGGEVILEIPVQKDERNFQSIYFELQREEISHINLYVNARLAMAMFGQKPATYHPMWGTITMTVASNVVAAFGDEPIVALHDLSPTYDPNDEKLPWHDEIEEFLRIFYTYSPETDPPPDDFDWMAYLRAKQIHRFLDARDGDVAPESIRAAFSTYAETAEQAYPSCELDFSARPHVGARAWHIFGTDDRSWRQAEFCGFDASIEHGDPFTPIIDCGPTALVATEPVGCSLVDSNDGLASFEVVDNGIPLGGTQMGGSLIGCPEQHTLELDLTPGYHRITVTAVGCDDFWNTRSYEIISLHT